MVNETNDSRQMWTNVHVNTRHLSSFYSHRCSISPGGLHHSQKALIGRVRIEEKPEFFFGSMRMASIGNQDGRDLRGKRVASLYI